MNGFQYRDPMYDSFDDYFCPDCGNPAEPPGLCDDCSPTVPSDDDTEVVEGYEQWNEEADQMRYLERDR